MNAWRRESRPRAGKGGRGRGPRFDPRQALVRLRPRPGTLLALALAGGAVVLTWADPFAKPEDNARLVNSRTGARRVFPTLVDADPTKATIELQAPDTPVVRIVPTPEGEHQLIHGDEVLGPVSNEDFEGLWSSLRLATAQRSAERGSHGVGQAGVIRISLPDESLTLSLGAAVAGGGVYGKFEAEGDTWVVETEMLTLVSQPPRSWISKRVLSVDAAQVTGLAWGDELVLGRGDDGFWRVRAGAQPALLSTEAVEFRLRRLLRAQLDPLVEREAVPTESLRPWLVVTTALGGAGSRALLVGGECPGHPSKRLVDRGPGLLGCVPAELLDSWTVLDAEGGMIEPRLVPHDYARIVGLELEHPAKRELLRRGGEWFFSAAEGGGVEGVAEEEVRRWYQDLGAIEVALAGPGGEPSEGPPPGLEGPPPGLDGGQDEELEPGPELAWDPDWVLIVEADTGDELRVRCDLGPGPIICARDGGPTLRVLGELPRNLVFDAETFAVRRLSEVGPGEIRELEILPPDPDQAEGPNATVRQSVHADMGTWQLDAPAHPDDSGAIDTVRLENILWALGGLRAEAWAEPSEAAPLRRLLAEVVPAEGRRRTVSVTLYPDCVVVVDDQRPAHIAEAQCAALSQDLMFDDPLRFWLERSRSVEVEELRTGARTFLRRRADQFVTAEGTPLADEDLAEQLARFIDWRSEGIRAGEPPGEPNWMIDIRRELGPGAKIEVGRGFARIAGADWYYVEREGEAEPVPDNGGDGFDPGAVEVDEP